MRKHALERPPRVRVPVEKDYGQTGLVALFYVWQLESVRQLRPSDLGWNPGARHRLAEGTEGFRQRLTAAEDSRKEIAVTRHAVEHGVHREGGRMEP